MSRRAAPSSATEREAPGEDEPTRPTVVILVENLAVPFDRRVWQEALALQSAGYRVHVVCPRSPQHPLGREVLEGVCIHRYRPLCEANNMAGYVLEYGVALVSMLAIVCGIARRGRIAVIQACNPPDLLFLAALPFVLGGRTRFVFDQHDVGPELMIAKGKSEHGIAVRLTRVLERVTFRLATVSIATNESYRDIAVGRGRMDPDNVFVVRSGPNVARFAEAAPSGRFHAGHRFLVAYVGVMGIQDGVDYLIDAAEYLVRKLGRTDVQFTLAGDGTEFGRLTERVDAMGLGSHVRFLGRVSDRDLGDLLASADVCVNPDEYNQMNDMSTMNKIMEYMALGRPIVQFDLTEGRVSAGAASLYVARNDASALAVGIAELLDEPIRREEMGEIGRARVATRLSWEHQVPALLEAYAWAMGNGPPGRLAGAA